MMPIAIASAQTVTISPNSNVTATVGGTVKFSAKVTGLSSDRVNWFAGGVLGGNSTSGKISTSGLFTAPSTLPTNNPVEIKVVSQADNTVKATVKVKILAAIAKLTSVSPNPLNVGSISVTLSGSGFQPGAVVTDTYGGSGHTLEITSLKPNTIVATGTQGTAESASFTVKNVNVAASNAISVPIKKFRLTVKNGTGGGSYPAGKVVTIKANAPPTGKVFKSWTGATVANSTSETTTLTMPSANATVTANYETVATKYQLTVNNGSGSGQNPAGTVVTIKSNAPPQGQMFLNWTGATVSNPTSESTTLTMPAAATTVTANYQTITSTYQLTVNNGTGSGAYASGTVVSISANAPPQGKQFLNWTGATVANPTSASTTLSMPAAATTVTANYTNITSDIPYPVSTHPRIWLTQSDLPRLQSWATASNPVYKKGMVPLLATAVNAYETQFFPGGNPNPTYPDLGDTQGYTGQLTEEVAMVLAFNSLIDPVPANRIKYATYARNLIMYALNQTALGFQTDTPFRDPTFLLYNRGDFSGHQWPLIVDWIYNTKDAQNNPILTAADKATIRKVFMMWAGTCLNASTTGGDHPEPVGVTNDLSLLNGGAGPYRMASNNYYLGHARNLTMLALSIDPSDDPAIDATKPLSALGNSLLSYILNANGAWLYQTYAMMGEPQQIGADYGLSNNGQGFGIASGGLPPEGMLYGESYATVLGQLLALQTAGFNNPAYSGPQVHLINAPVWDRFVASYLASLSPTGVVNPAAPYLGPLYYFATFGDVLQTWVTPDIMQPLAMLGVLDQARGVNTHVDSARWFTTNAVQGGVINNASNPWTWGCMQSVLYYLLLDPTKSAPVDPRPTLPLNYFDSFTGRAISHSDWTSNPTMFTYRASWTSINHQQGDAGVIGLFRNGEWLTSEMSNYDNNLVGFTSYYLNGLGLKNWCANGTPNLSWDETGIWANGGQWMWAANAGDPTTLSSSGAGYTYVASNLTNLYNRPDQWTPANRAVDISQATRSALWLNKDFIVVYDRATSIHPGLPKTFNLSLVSAPTITGNVTHETLPSGQNLFIQTLLPSNAKITSRAAAGDLNPIAEFETMSQVLTVQDPSLPSDTRFLHVLQGANSGASMSTATYFTNTSGTAFDGAAFGTNAVFFIAQAKANVVTTKFSVPATCTTFFAAGLAGNSAYTVTTQTSGSTKTVTLTLGGSNLSDSAGLLKVAI